MSADNTIFVVEYPTESGIRYRVFHVMAAENMQMFPNASHYFTWVLQTSPVIDEPLPYAELETAMEAAKKLQKDLCGVEYGIKRIKAPEEIPVEAYQCPPWVQP